MHCDNMYTASGWLNTDYYYLKNKTYNKRGNAGLNLQLSKSEKGRRWQHVRKSIYTKTSLEKNDDILKKKRKMCTCTIIYLQRSKSEIIESEPTEDSCHYSRGLLARNLSYLTKRASHV